MTEKDFKRLWKNFLFDIDKTNAVIAADLGTTPQKFGKKINNGTIRFLELASIFERYGYRLELVKDEKKEHQTRHSKKGIRKDLPNGRPF